jgi:PhoH-like ATPase
MKKEDLQRKLYFVDTNVLLYDSKSIHAFVGNTVCIAIQVLDELDKFKDVKGVIGENARYVNRFLDSLRSKGNISEGILCEQSDIIYKVVLPKQKNNKKKKNTELTSLESLDSSVVDNRIIASALQTHQDEPHASVIVVTKDINMRVKCDALNIKAQDYTKDSIQSLESSTSVWSGVITKEVDFETIESFHEEEYMDLDENLFPNSLIVLKSGNSSGVGIVSQEGNSVKRVCYNLEKICGIIPYDKEQAYALKVLEDPNIPLVTLTGAPGSGKTYMTLLVGLHKLVNDKKSKYNRIIITRSIQPVGRDLGFLPGDMGEKMSPWLAPIKDNFRQAYNDLTYFDQMIKNGTIEVAPLSYIRGRSFPNSYIIVDEAQNATIHELKTIITRAGENSKIVLMGDIEQIDTPYIDRLSNGLSIVIDKFKTSSLAAHIHLQKGRRSELANEANKLL